MQGSDKLVRSGTHLLYFLISLQEKWKTTRNRVEQALVHAWVDQPISPPLPELGIAAAKLGVYLVGNRIRPAIGVFLIGNET